jgi:hypothetical protein
VSRGTAEQLRADTNALVKHVLATSKREHISAQELEQIASLWAACWQMPEGAPDNDAWAEFRLFYGRLMGDYAAPLDTRKWPR